MTFSETQAMSNSTISDLVTAKPDHLVILVHGINTWAYWMVEIRRVLQNAGFAVAPTSFDQYSVLRFLAPFPHFFRRKAIERVTENVRTAIRQHKKITGREPSKMSVISHSFGTYIVSVILTTPEFSWYRVIFCGSVLRNDFNFDPAEKQFDAPLLNEVGTRDFLPALAASAGWDYGSVGSNGLNHPLVVTRWHKDHKHSDFLTADFCKAFWVPFLQSQEPIPGDKATADDIPHWIRAIAAFPLRWIIVFVGLALPVGLTYLLWLWLAPLNLPTWLTCFHDLSNPTAEEYQRCNP
jgi:Putative serine esterase (DUF676)